MASAAVINFDELVAQMLPQILEAIANIEHPDITPLDEKLLSILNKITGESYTSILQAILNKIPTELTLEGGNLSVTVDTAKVEALIQQILDKMTTNDLTGLLDELKAINSNLTSMMDKLDTANASLDDIKNTLKTTIVNALNQILAAVNEGNAILGSMDSTLNNIGTNTLNTIEELKKILGVLESCKILIENLNQNAKPGIQKIKGLSLSVPAVAGDYSMAFSPLKDILLTGITYSQSGWKSQDNWDLKANEITLFESVFTKELGENKHLNKWLPVPIGSNIEIVLHNISGNSRTVWADIEYIELIS